METPRISFLVPNISLPTVGAAVRLATALKDRYDVEIVGPDFGHGICSMYRDAFDFKVVPCPRMYRLPDFWWESRRLGRAVSGDVIVAVKAFADTLPVALREKRRRGARVIAYLDEWDGALYEQMRSAGRIKALVKDWHHPLESVHCPRVERLLSQADEVVSSSAFLQRKFGGRVVPLGVDCEFFRPQNPHETARLRREVGLEGRRVLVFGGVARPHKGVETFLEALACLRDRAADKMEDVVLLVVGPKTDHLGALMLKGRYSGLVHCAGDPPGPASTINWEVHRRMPSYLDLADAIVVPLGDSLLARSQMPCKVFEAMAMAKPIIASAVSDLPAVLDGCGWLVAPDDVDAAARAIEAVLADPAAAAGLGRAAREKCLEHYDLRNVAQEWKGILDGLCN